MSPDLYDTALVSIAKAQRQHILLGQEKLPDPVYGNRPVFSDFFFHTATIHHGRSKGKQKRVENEEGL